MMEKAGSHEAMPKAVYKLFVIAIYLGIVTGLEMKSLLSWQMVVLILGLVFVVEWRAVREWLNLLCDRGDFSLGSPIFKFEFKRKLCCKGDAQ